MISWALAAWWLDRQGRRTLPPQTRVDAVVVAGCAVWPRAQPSPALQRRVDRAAQLYFRGVADQVVLTGGVGRHPPAEALVAARAIVAAGVPHHCLVVEDASRNTEENAAASARLIGSQASIVVVTDRWHVVRCERTFARHFAAVQAVGTDRAPRRRQLRATLGEVANIVRHRWRGTW